MIRVRCRVVRIASPAHVIRLSGPHITGRSRQVRRGPREAVGPCYFGHLLPTRERRVQPSVSGELAGAIARSKGPGGVGDQRLVEPGASKEGRWQNSGFR